MRWIPFVAENREILDAAVIRFAKQINNPAASKMTKEKYLHLCEIQGYEPDMKAMPLDINDFPQIVHTSLNIFNQLRDSYIPAEIPVYVGKDLSALTVLYDVYGITSSNIKQLVLKYINIFDSAAVTASAARAANLRKKSRLPSATGGSRN